MVSKRKLGATPPLEAPAAVEPAPTATAQIMTLPPGRYVFSVTAAKPAAGSLGAGLPPPAMHISPGPGLQPGQIEFLSMPQNPGGWLSGLGDSAVAKVNSSGVSFVLTSVRTPGGLTLSIDVRRMEESETVPAQGVDGKSSVRLKITTHHRNKGDLTFVGQPWAGRAGKGLWIEGFSVGPLEGIDAQDLEYKALTASGFETPWLSDGAYCGTRGMSVPLIGFSVRLKPGPKTAAYECEYSGAFQSGSISGPLRGGAPCRSSIANDPLEGIQIRVVEGRPPATASAASAVAPARIGGPRFSKFREDEIQEPASAAPAAKKKPGAVRETAGSTPGLKAPASGKVKAAAKSPAKAAKKTVAKALAKTPKKAAAKPVAAKPKAVAVKKRRS